MLCPADFAFIISVLMLLELETFTLRLLLFNKTLILGQVVLNLSC